MEGHPYELAMFAEPGRDMPAHLQELERWGPVVKADVLLYQRYVNDIEVMSHRPDDTLVVPVVLRTEVVASVPELADVSASIGTLQLVDAATGETVASGRITTQGGVRGYQTLTVTLDVPGTEPRRLRVRVATSGEAGWSLASLGLAVDDTFEVVDLAEPLNRFNTHTSLFDAHPNEAAHRVIADEVHHVLRSE